MILLSSCANIRHVFSRPHLLHLFLYAAIIVAALLLIMGLPTAAAAAASAAAMPQQTKSDTSSKGVSEILSKLLFSSHHASLFPSSSSVSDADTYPDSDETAGPSHF